MGYVFTYDDAAGEEETLNPYQTDLGTRLMLSMLAPRPGESLLDIGCGTGRNTLPLLDRKLHVTGLDPSPFMLDIADRRLGDRVDLHCGFAEELPFEDNAFNHACLFTSLEYVNDPVKAVEEAARVAKDRVFIGVRNRYALSGFHDRIKGLFTTSIHNRAQFFSVWELKGIVRKILGNPPLKWRTACQFPLLTGRMARSVERNRFVQRSPLGTYIGMVFAPVPSFTTTPLTLQYSIHPTAGSGVAGFARNLRDRSPEKNNGKPGLQRPL